LIVEAEQTIGESAFQERLKKIAELRATDVVGLLTIKG
jgi:hypothetical protein